MVHFYCFIDFGSAWTLDTKVFKVKVGDSRRDQVKRQLVDCYANDVDAFFRIWDEDTDFYLAQMQRYKRHFPDIGKMTSNVVQTDIHTLYRNILDGTLDSLENPPHVIRNIFRMTCLLSPDFFFKNHSARRAPSVPPVARKNLSVRPTPDDTIAAVGFALIALLYWLGSLVGCWEKVVL